MFHFWVNVELADKVMRLEKKELDGPHYDRAGKYDNDFAIELYFR